MHSEAYSYIAAALLDIQTSGMRVLELGSKNINGSVRTLLPDAIYTGVDVRPGPGVDIVSDCKDYDGAHAFDLVISTETLEHMPHPRHLIACARRALKPGGVLLITCAARERAAHGVDGGAVGDEHYDGIAPEALGVWLKDWRGVEIEHHADRGDLYARAMAPTRARPK